MFENYSHWAISSQAPQECGEGSTTRARSPERTVKPQECAASLKPCRKCGAIDRYADGKCRPCRNARSARYYSDNKEKVSERHQAYSKDNAENRRRVASEWAKANRAKRAETWAAYYTAKIRAMPRWVDRNEIKKVYDEARNASLLDGTKYHVDHIVPLQGEKVCGLHVPWNLQLLPATVNAAKRNSFKDD